MQPSSRSPADNPHPHLPAGVMTTGENSKERQFSPSAAASPQASLQHLLCPAVCWGRGSDEPQPHSQEGMDVPSATQPAHYLATVRLHRQAGSFGSRTHPIVKFSRPKSEHRINSPCKLLSLELPIRVMFLCICVLLKYFLLPSCVRWSLSEGITRVLTPMNTEEGGHELVHQILESLCMRNPFEVKFISESVMQWF